MKKIKWYLLLLCFSLVLLAESNSVASCYAYTQTSGKVVTTSGKVRQEANTSSSVLASVKSGDTLTITDEVTGNDGNVWYQVFVNAQQKGYIRSDLVQKSGSSSTTSANAITTSTTTTTKVTAIDKKSGTILKDSVRVRKEASTSADVVATVGRGVVLTVEGEATGTDSKKWYSVSFSYNGKSITGFVRNDFITFEALPEEEPDVTEITGPTGAEGEGDEDATEPAEGGDG